MSPLLAHARADQVATLYRSWHRTTASMVLGALILCGVLWQQEASWVMAAWLAAILVNQAWRGVLARAYRRAQPRVADAARWGAYWAIGSTLAGALWGAAAIAMFPASPSYQALFIVCQFGVILGGLNLTAVYKPSFYGFVLAALVPLIARVAVEGDQVHLFTAGVLGVVLVFVLAFGRQVNGVLTQSLAMRYENVDLIRELQAQTEAALAARAAAESASRAKSQFLAAASHDLRQPLHAMGLFAAALAARVRDPEVRPLVASIRASVEALEELFAQLLDLSRLDAGALEPARASVALGPLFARLAADFAPQASAAGLALRIVPTRLAVDTDPVLLERILRNLVANAVRYTPAGGIVVGARRRAGAVRVDVIDSGHRHRRARPRARLRRVRAAGRGAPTPCRRARHGARARDRAAARDAAAGIRSSSRRLRAAARASRSRCRARTCAAATAGRTRAGERTPRGNRAHARGPSHRRRRRRSGRGRRHARAVRLLEGDRRGRRRRELGPGRPRRRRWLRRATSVDLIVADLRLADGKSGIDAIARLRDALGSATPALVVSGDTSGAAQAEVRAAGVELLVKPVVAAALKDAAEGCAWACGPIRIAAPGRGPPVAGESPHATLQRNRPGARPGRHRSRGFARRANA